MNDKFTCAHCGGTFDKGWSEEEASAEALEQFGTDPAMDPTMAVVCDDCYRMMTTAMPPSEWLRRVTLG